MDMDTWFYWYNEILDNFGFDSEMDNESAKLLEKILEDKGSLSPSDFKLKHNAIIFGAGPSLKRNIKEIKYLNAKDFSFICADGAVTALLEENFVPDIVVTDLDGNIEDIINSNKKGAIMVVHAHGNNMDNIKKYVPALDNIMGTTQNIPLDNVYNFGGFTDGDRCIFLAVELGVKNIILAGMDFGKIITHYSRPEISKMEDVADSIKEKKLIYGKKLTEWVAENEDVTILNLSHGEKINGVQDIQLEHLLQIPND